MKKDNSTTPPPDAGQPEITDEMLEAGALAIYKITGIKPWPSAIEAAYLAMRPLDRAPLAPPRKVMEAMVTEALEAYHYYPGKSPHEPPHLPGAIMAMLADLTAALNAPARVDARDWEGEYKALSHALVGDTGASAILVASQLREQINAIIPAAGFFDPEDEDQIFEVALKYSENFHAMKRELAEMRDICGGEVGEITRTPEEQAALERAMGDENARRETLVAKIMETSAREPGINDLMKLQRVGQENPNTLPMEMMPEGWEFDTLQAVADEYSNEVLSVLLRKQISFGIWQRAEADGPTPRAAMIAAIEAARERGDG